MVITGKENYGKYGECVSISAGGVKILVTTQIGPRIIYMGKNGGPNVLFEDVNDAVNTPEEKLSPVLKGKGGWHIYGGHRLWRSPEDIDTYYPDNAPVQVRMTDNGAEFVSDTELTTKLQKSMLVTMDDNGEVTVVHKFVNKGDKATSPISIWALTVMAGGAEVHIPYDTSDTGFLPNRNISFWSYHSVKDERLHINDDEIVVDFNDKVANPLKIGTMCVKGYLYAYTKGGKFTIKFDVPEGLYPDFSCNLECYTYNLFTEMESLSPLKSLAPGESCTHKEVWTLE